MKNIIKLLTFALLFLSMQSWGQAQKTLIKSISFSNPNSTTIELPGKVVLSEWDKDFVRVTVTVEVLNTSEDILKRLVEAGRYDIISNETNSNILLISMPKVAHAITIKGTVLEEKIHFEVMMPKGAASSIKVPSFLSSSQSL